MSAASVHHSAFISVSTRLKTSASSHNFMNIAEVKYILNRKGVINSHQVSLDLTPLSSDDIYKLDKESEELLDS